MIVFLTGYLLRTYQLRLFLLSLLTFILTIQAGQHEPLLIILSHTPGHLQQMG
ncbi:hypothetical protein D3C72_2313230 [compost metagenome]